MRPVVTATEMRQLDRATIDEVGLPGAVLMETAGRAVADAVSRCLAGRTGPVAVIAGPGNNGGDGHVAARALRARGVDAVVYLAAARADVRGDARLHLDALERAGGVVHDLSTPAALAAHAAALAGAQVIVDALVGTGLGRALAGHLAAVVDHVNASAATVVAADLPSGLDADTGVAAGAVVDADVTVTMAALKIALVSAPGFVRAGEVTVAEIGIPRARIEAAAVGAGLLEAADLRAAAPRPAVMDHKGRRGHVLIVAGSPGKRGAGRLAAAAALRGGAGLVTLAGAGPGELAAADPIMTATCDEPGALRVLAAGKDAIVIGPGMLRGAAGEALVAAALALGIPLVLDADALNQIGALARVATATAPVILTPHPGEAARLLGGTVASVEGDRLAAVRALASASGAVAVLKGARTLICDGAVVGPAPGFVAVNPTGSPALASGGTGDVLAGLLGALLAQGLSARAAARVGVWVHGEAGARAGARVGIRATTAEDVLADLGLVLDELSRG